MEDKLRQFFESNFKDAVVREDLFRDQLSFYIRKEYLYDVCEALISDDALDVKFLSDICALDWLGDPEEKNGRFEVVYNFFSLKHKYRFFIKVRLDDDTPEIDSIAALWQTANWLEREVTDLMGVVFTGHPDPRKILTPDDLEGHPHRKDFPLTYEIPQFSYNKNEPPEVIK
ncbi:MAG: NADH-quinone oxidoreductase subunit C [candidate division Zixibacteria bacterium]|nr:NADH-quinone oxidoreductase subunit C [candidate division Zixibacteria bacterium]